MKFSYSRAFLLALLSLFTPTLAVAGNLDDQLMFLVNAVNPKVLDWRRDIHRHPELGNREYRTAALVADHLRSLDFVVQTDVAHTGVVAVLRGGKPGPVVIFGLHTFPAPIGTIGYRAGGIMAGADALHIIVEGRQTHGAVPWAGVDPVVVAAQIVLALQIIPSRQLDSTKGPTIISIGSIHGGLRSKIIPNKVEMEGTIRILDPLIREDVLQRIRRTAVSIAESAGARATVKITAYAPVTYNDPSLMSTMLPSLRKVAGSGLIEVPPITPSEDFSYFQQKIPGLYFFLGVNAKGVGRGEAAYNHSPSLLC